MPRSHADEALDDGDDALDEESSEWVTFRDSSVLVNIDRGPEEILPEHTRANLKQRGSSIVRIRRCQVNAMPRVGEDFIDSDSNQHRILNVRIVDREYRCFCHTTPPSTQE